MLQVPRPSRLSFLSHEHCAPVHLSEPSRAPHALFGHDSFPSISPNCCFILRGIKSRRFLADKKEPTWEHAEGEVYTSDEWGVCAMLS